MHVWAGGQGGPQIRGGFDESCKTVMGPEDTWSELCGMCLHHRSGTQNADILNAAPPLLRPAVSSDTVSHYFLLFWGLKLEISQALCLDPSVLSLYSDSLTSVHDDIITAQYMYVCVSDFMVCSFTPSSLGRS